jgi:hypothetical protein
MNTELAEIKKRYFNKNIEKEQKTNELVLKIQEMFDFAKELNRTIKVIEINNDRETYIRIIIDFHTFEYRKEDIETVKKIRDKSNKYEHDFKNFLYFPRFQKLNYNNTLTDLGRGEIKTTFDFFIFESFADFNYLEIKNFIKNNNIIIKEIF